MTHVVFVGDSLFYEGTDESDALFNCPPNGRVVCLDDNQLYKMSSRYNRTLEAQCILEEYAEWN